MLPLKLTVREYIREDGSSPYKKWVESLDAEAAAKVTTAKLRIKRGLTSAIKWFEGIGEYIIDWGPGYRIYLAQDGKDVILLLGGGTKKRQIADIREAIRLHAEHKARKSARLKSKQNKFAKNMISRKSKRSRR